MKFERLLKGGLALAMSMVMVACASESTGTTTTGSSTSAYEGSGDLTSYKLGTLGPRTGAVAVYGLAVTNAARLAVDDWNAAHGTKIEMLYEDTQANETQALNIYNKFVSDDKVAAIIGGTISSESIAIAGASSDTGIPIISPSATAAAFTNDSGNNVFRGCYTDPQQAQLVADFAIDTLGVKKAAILYNMSDDYSTGLEEAFKKEFESKGGTVVVSESYPADTVDFRTQLTKISGEDIDVLFVPNYYQDDFNITQQARELGITAQILGCDGWDGVLSVAGNNASVLEGAVFINQYSPDMESVQGIMESYRKAYGEEINSFGINAYDATMLVLNAVEKAGSLKAEDIIAQIRSSEYQGILGSIKFDDNGDPIKTPIYVTIKDGQYVTYGK